MRNIFLITKREYLTQVKKKSFLILTILTPLLIVAFGIFIGFLFKANKAELNIQVLDKSGIFENKLTSTEEIAYTIVSPSSEKQVIENLKDSESVDGILIIAHHTGNWEDLENNSELLMRSKIGFDTKKQIVNDLTEILRKEKIKELNISTETIDNVDKSFELKAKNINNQDIDSDLDFGVKYGLGIALMYVTFMFIIMYGVRVMRSVLEEKNNRVVEIIISSVKPFELMIGKIIGVTLVAITQFSIWIIMTVISTLVLSNQFNTINENIPENEVINNIDILEILSQISGILLDLNVPLIIFVFIFFFIFGYIFYSSIYAAIGSAVDNETETQQFTLFAIIPLMVGVYGSFTIVNNPDGPLGFWLSIIPFTSPVAMMARIPFGVPAWEIVLSIFLLVATSLLMIFIAGKVYRVGILMHGNKASLKDILKWIKG